MTFGEYYMIYIQNLVTHQICYTTLNVNVVTEMLHIGVYVCKQLKLYRQVITLSNDRAKIFIVPNPHPRSIINQIPCQIDSFHFSSVITAQSSRKFSFQGENAVRNIVRRINCYSKNTL